MHTVSSVPIAQSVVTRAWIIRILFKLRWANETPATFSHSSYFYYLVLHRTQWARKSNFIVARTGCTRLSCKDPVHTADYDLLRRGHTPSLRLACLWLKIVGTSKSPGRKASGSIKGKKNAVAEALKQERKLTHNWAQNARPFADRFSSHAYRKNLSVSSRCVLSSLEIIARSLCQ